MNTTSNTIDNPTHTGSTGGGSNVGNKIKGAFKVVHGIGENIRGTALGAADTMSHNGNTKNDMLAQQGRLETEQGLKNLRGGGGGVGVTTGGPYTAEAAPGQSLAAGGHNPEFGSQMQSQGNYAQGTWPQGTTGTQSSYPQHHTNDAQTNLPTQPQADYVQPLPQETTQSSSYHPHHHRDDAQTNLPTQPQTDYAQPLSQGITQSSYPHHRDDAQTNLPTQPQNNFTQKPLPQEPGDQSSYPHHHDDAQTNLPTQPQNNFTQKPLPQDPTQTPYSGHHGGDPHMNVPASYESNAAGQRGGVPGSNFATASKN